MSLSFLGETTDVVDAIRTRRARRVLSDMPIEDDKVDALVEAVRLSASCNNNQPWRLVIVRGKEALAAIKAALPRGNAWATRSPMIIVVAARDADDCKLSDNRNYFLFSTGLSIGQLELRATELGLIAHPIAGFDPLKAKELLGIPQDYVVITFVICGYPGTDDSLLSDKQKALEPNRPDRKPIGENIFIDKWGTPYK